MFVNATVQTGKLRTNHNNRLAMTSLFGVSVAAVLIMISFKKNCSETEQRVVPKEGVPPLERYATS